MENNSSNSFLDYALKDWSAKALILSNIVAIFFAIIENWNFLTVAFIYWCQSVIIGFFNVIKIYDLKNFSTNGFAPGLVDEKDSNGVKSFAILIFIIFYGMFHAAYLFFILFYLFVSPVSLMTFLNVFIVLTIIVFFINHFFSYYYNKEKNALRRQHIGKVIMFPFARILPMHLTFIFGSIFLMVGFPQITLIIFLILKTLTDVIMHLVEHKSNFLENMLNRTFNSISKSGFR